MSHQVQIIGPTFSSFVRSVMLCCEEKGVSYSTGMEYQGQPLALRDEKHLALNPFGKIPILLDGDHTIYETAAICKYIDEAFDGADLQPESAADRAEVAQWAQLISLYVDKTVIRDYLLEFAFPKGENGAIRMDKIQSVTPELDQRLTILTNQLGAREYICGERYTFADALLTPMLDYLLGLPHGSTLIEPGSALEHYVQRMRQRPSGIAVLNRAKG